MIYRYRLSADKVNKGLKSRSIQGTTLYINRWLYSETRLFESSNLKGIFIEELAETREEFSKRPPIPPPAHKLPKRKNELPKSTAQPVMPGMTDEVVLESDSRKDKTIPIKEPESIVPRPVKKQIKVDPPKPLELPSFEPTIKTMNLKQLREACYARGFTALEVEERSKTYLRQLLELDDSLED